MRRCKLCLYPDTKPDLHFDAEGVCSACRNFQNRPAVDWPQREHELRNILQAHGGRCVVASSGGKDSHYIALKLIEMGARPLIVTASTCHLTPTGRHNIDNLAYYASTIEVTANRSVRAKLNRLALELVGDISWPEHASIFTVPLKIASKLGYGLVFYGENPQREYGGPLGSEQAKGMNARWISEFGGLLGLRASDFIGQAGITEADMADYSLESIRYATPHDLETKDYWGADVYFLGQFLPWDSHENADLALRHGMMGWLPAPCEANWWGMENLDNAQTGLHDHFMFRKYGYGRGVAQISVDIRHGRISREAALKWARAHDGRFPQSYMGVLATDIIERIGMEWRDFLDCLDRHTNWEIFARTTDPLNPKLKEGSWD